MATGRLNERPCDCVRDVPTVPSDKIFDAVGRGDSDVSGVSHGICGYRGGADERFGQLLGFGCSVE